MKDGIVRLETLEVIGYADRLPEGRGPAIVPPVFRIAADPSRCYVPPFRLTDRILLDPQPVPHWDVLDMARKAQVTLPAALCLPARANWILWVDLDGGLHYEPETAARKALHRIHDEQLELAFGALRKGDFDSVSRLAAAAGAAKPGSLKPVALTAVCFARRGQEAKVQFVLKHLAEDMETCRLLMGHYAAMLPASATADLKMSRLQEISTEDRSHPMLDSPSDMAVFVFPIEAKRYLLPVLRNATFASGSTTVAITCTGGDRIFLESVFENYNIEQVHARKRPFGRSMELVRQIFITRSAYGSREPLPSDVISRYSNLDMLLSETGPSRFTRDIDGVRPAVGFQ